LPERLSGVLAVVYLIFTQGYKQGYADDESPEHRTLRQEAIRLGKLIASLMPDEPETLGLVALMLLHDSRAAARYSGDGDVVQLKDQDRSRWNRAEITEAVGLLGRALRYGTVGVYQLQASIAALHAEAVSAQRTDWPRIATLYAQLLAIAPSPVVALNHAVAVAMADAPADGLALIERIDGLERYHLLHAARADLLSRLGRREEAAAAYRRAHELATGAADRRFLAGRLLALDIPGST
jgi:RNA polymerase sigma-70 factor (ECF subfamily)